MAKPICFIIQEFDDGEFFDKLYDLVIERAVSAAGFDPKRADKILGAKPPLKKIQEALEASNICIAEATINNPNVFLEIGWAIGLGKPFFVLWDKKQRPEGLPFDISHNAGIPYDSSKKNWEKDLITKITQNLTHELSTAKSLPIEKIGHSNNSKYNDLEYIVLALLLSAKSKHREAGILQTMQALISYGLDQVKITLAIEKLSREGLVDRTHNYAYGDAACHYYLTSYGIEFIEQNYDHIDPFIKKIA